jgi:hypothetical protein
MDVVLHVGAHRTASTTFQKTLGANRAALAEAGVVYWGPKCTRAGLLHGLIGRPAAQDAGMRAMGVARVARRVRAVERSGARMLLVSEENVLGSMQAALSGAGFYADARARVAVLAEAFGAHRLTIALAIRAQDAWWRSADGFLAARLGADRAHVLSDRLAAQPRTWRDVIGDVARAPERSQVVRPRVVVWPHEALGTSARGGFRPIEWRGRTDQATARAQECLRRRGCQAFDRDCAASQTTIHRRSRLAACRGGWACGIHRCRTGTDVSGRDRRRKGTTR